MKSSNAEFISAGSKTAYLLSLLIVGIPVLLAFISIALKNWGQIFDDAFISYRYAQNLAMGYGLTWNPGYPPTEGYTNPLLVLMLAPVIWAGLDPLLFTRISSIICVIAISAILFNVARRRYHCSHLAAIMIAAIIFMFPATAIICILGLETVIYACLLLLTFIAGTNFIDRQQLRGSIMFSCLLFLTMLLRPEAILLYPVISAAALFTAVRHKTGLKPLLAGLLLLLAMGGAYLAWKYFHFGQLLPNPFYIKASGNTLISPDGLQSVHEFINDYFPVLAFALASLLLTVFAHRNMQRWNRIAVLAGSVFVVMYCLFFMHVDTLMDISGRFLYPLVPLIILLAIPSFSRTMEFFESFSKYKIYVLPVLMLAFLFAFGGRGIFKIEDRINWLTSHQAAPARVTPMQKEYLISKALARFPPIREVRIAFADSGVMPYFSGAIWLDVVGLNDGFIAKSRSKKNLLDYFFIWSPDMVIHPGKFGMSWLRMGHGPLGDYLSWSNDPRWDEYEYVGTSTLEGFPYDLQ
ncbi:MAG: hypothetical protein ABI536_01080, partial [Gallionella sp.]